MDDPGKTMDDPLISVIIHGNPWIIQFMDDDPLTFLKYFVDIKSNLVSATHSLEVMFKVMLVMLALWSLWCLWQMQSLWLWCLCLLHHHWIHCRKKLLL
jgi:hypothetical protein